MKIVNKAEFDAIVKNGYTLVDFYADWCGPCKALSPVLEELSNDYPNVNFVKVNVDNEEELAMQYRIMSIPAIFILKDGEVVTSVVGSRPKDAMKAVIDSALNK